jgi:hypothetical protein
MTEREGFELGKVLLALNRLTKHRVQISALEWLGRWQCDVA